MNVNSLNLILADDDPDDRMLFNDALKELPVQHVLKTVNDGEQLMSVLTSNTGKLPDVIFLDLNMPRKNGFECLSEIKVNEQLKTLPVIIYSTSLDYNVVDMLYDRGADRYIRKPGDFSMLKQIIQKALLTVSQNSNTRASRDNFIIKG